MAQTALSRASTCFTCAPLMNNRKAAPLKESIFTRCYTVLWLLACLVPGCRSVSVRPKNELPANPNLPVCPISVWGVNSPEDGRLQASCAYTMCLRTLCPPKGSKNVSGWSGKWHLDSSHCFLPQTRSHREHCHTSRKVWRAENAQKCCSVAERKTELLSITLCELLTSLSSQDSVLMERLLWKDSMVSPFLGGLHY